MVFGKLENLARVLRPMRTARELADEHLGEIVICTEGKQQSPTSLRGTRLTERLVIPNTVVGSIAREVEHHHTLAPIRIARERDLTEKVREGLPKFEIDSRAV